MRVVVVSCWKYRDAWKPMFALLKKFWPDCPYPLWLVTDVQNDGSSRAWTSDAGQAWVSVSFKDTGWCSAVADFCKKSATHDGLPENTPILLLQEDFFLNAPVRQDLIEHALSQMQRWNAGMIRLYPCPGANAWYDDDRVGFVAPASDYSISCQASIWQPDYLYQIASQCDTPQSFELKGSKIAATLDRKLLAWRRESEPWPLTYLCSAIGRGLWSQDAKRLCDQHEIEVDWSMRGFQPA